MTMKPGPSVKPTPYSAAALFDMRSATLALSLAMASTFASADRFAVIVEAGAEPTVTTGGYLVNNKRIAVQKELTHRPPTAEELGVKLPPSAKLQLEPSARQIAQYHPAWRVYEYRIEMPRADFLEHFQKQGLTFDRSSNKLKFANEDGDFVDGLSAETIMGFRVWRKPISTPP